ncbi:hypothetical protein [Calothrix sp. PCC 6303]|uniref:hypothetical protein n=1 Tax=Calothrix sp. PCC 6303 TaxID=1170562 RepID=UPI0002A0069D|nr:hypothetical protein [Calothrix sp. PCC 6303]AFZ03116.1 hypothetical protein Cal6303_4205 [Calothrix sp. PCC 6303]
MNITSTAVANNSLTIVSFLAIATVLSGGGGWLIKTGNLPLSDVITFSERQWQFMRIWLRVALVIGVIVPFVMLITLWNQSIVRQFLGSYLGVVAIQLVCEVSFSRLFVKSVVVIIGTIYTIFRLWQLWEGLHLANYTQVELGLLWLILLFWVANLIILIFMSIPSIVHKSEHVT